MAGMNVSWGNSLIEFQNGIKDTSDNVKKDTKDIVKDTGKKILTDAKKNTPVETGKLRRGWNLKNKKKETIVENKVDYVVYVENGTSKAPPKRMFSKALKGGEKYMNKRLDKLGRNMKRDFE